MKKLLSLVFCCFLTSVLLAQRTDTTLLDNGLLFVDLFNAEANDNIACYRIPAIITAPNGNLVAAIDERVPNCNDLRDNRDINIVIRRSMDNGKTWTPIESVVDYPDGISASDPSMIVDQKTGEIFMFFNYMDLDKARNVYFLQYVKSRDNGKTWSKPVDITDQISKPDWHNDFKFITSGRGFYTADGKMLHTLVNLQHGMHVFGSDDHGKSWYLIDTPITPGDESKVITLPNGQWMVNSRTHKTGLRYVHTSSDYGKTWHTRPDSLLIDPGCNASLITYEWVEGEQKKNLLLFSNAFSPDKRENMTVSVSDDNGKTWFKSKTIYPGPSAYSSMTVLENGDIGLFFEKDGYKENVFVKFSLEWLLWE